MEISFQGRVVVITGATRGIGACMAQEFHANGATLILTGTNPTEVDELNAREDRLGTYLCVDLGVESSLMAFLDTLRKLDQIDVCINNAGINPPNALGMVDLAELDSTIAVNLRAPFLISQAVSGAMSQQGYGRILNIASIWSVASKPNRSTYCATKAGLAGLTRAISNDLGSFGVLVNTLSPGFVLTDMTKRNLTPEEQTKLVDQVPLKRFAEPLEIAKFAMFLCSDMNTYLTGQNICVDGGFTIV